MARLRPVCTDMPTQGLFLIRQPSCVAFSLTLWTCRSGRRIIYTAYCLLAPRRKERSFAACYGDRFGRYRTQMCVLPHLPQPTDQPDAQ